MFPLLMPDVSGVRIYCWMWLQMTEKQKQTILNDAHEYGDKPKEDKSFRYVEPSEYEKNQKASETFGDFAALVKGELRDAYKYLQFYKQTDDMDF